MTLSRLVKLEQIWGFGIRSTFVIQYSEIWFNGYHSEQFFDHPERLPGIMFLDYRCVLGKKTTRMIISTRPRKFLAVSIDSLNNSIHRKLYIFLSIYVIFVQKRRSSFFKKVIRYGIFSSNLKYKRWYNFRELNSNVSGNSFK